jgi:hypothetical protein
LIRQAKALAGKGLGQPRPPNGAFRDIGAGRHGGGMAQMPIDGRRPPVLFAPVEKVEEDRAGDDRHTHVTDGEAPAPRPQRGLDAAHRIEAERRPTREHQSIDALDGHARLQQGGVADTRCPSADRHRGHRRLVKDHDGDAGRDRAILGLPDLEARHVGDRIDGHATNSSAV